MNIIRLHLLRLMENRNTNSKKSSTLGYTATTCNIEPSGQDIHQNTTKLGTPRKTSTMQRSPSEDFITITPTSPEFSPMTDKDWAACVDIRLEQTSEKDRKHASMSWTACYDDKCKIHLGEKEGTGYYPRERHRTPPKSSPLGSPVKASGT